jgi:hypothetical protein
MTAVTCVLASCCGFSMRGSSWRVVLLCVLQAAEGGGVPGRPESAVQKLVEVGLVASDTQAHACTQTPHESHVSCLLAV